MPRIKVTPFKASDLSKLRSSSQATIQRSGGEVEEGEEATSSPDDKADPTSAPHQPITVDAAKERGRDLRPSSAKDTTRRNLLSVFVDDEFVVRIRQNGYQIRSDNDNLRMVLVISTLIRLYI